MLKPMDKKPRSGANQHVVRTADGRYIALRMTRKLAMACLCTECLGFEDNPMLCTAKTCPIYPFRAKTLRTKKGTQDKP